MPSSRYPSVVSQLMPYVTTSLSTSEILDLSRIAVTKDITIETDQHDHRYGNLPGFRPRVRSHGSSPGDDPFRQGRAVSPHPFRGKGRMQQPRGIGNDAPSLFRPERLPPGGMRKSRIPRQAVCYMRCFHPESAKIHQVPTTISIRRQR